MLPRGIWGIAIKTSKIQRGQWSSSFSCSYHAHDKKILPATNFSRIFDSHDDKISISRADQTPQRYFSHRNLSTETKIMDGQGDRKVLNLDYETLLEAQNKGDMIIDVREQNEINETGKLPGSIHIPMGDVTNQLQNLSSDAFKTKFEKSKPNKDTKIILSCRSGMRSGKVQEQLQKLGYENVYNYNGGWLEWESKQKV